MTVSEREIILRRLGRELRQVGSVVLGEGLPLMVEPWLLSGTQTFSMNGNGTEMPAAVDVAVVEAAEVSHQGELVLSVQPPQRCPAATRWIVATRHTHPNGDPKLVRQCSQPASVEDRVGMVITELGVIEVSPTGLILTEVAPGVPTDTVKMRTSASLHIADDIRLMEL